MKLTLKRLVKGNKGFTLIEIIIVVTIVAILASAIVPLAGISRKRAKELELRNSLRLIRTAIDNYKKAYDDKRMMQEIDRSGYPESLSELVEGVEDVKDPEGKMIYFLRRLPRDPMNANEFLSPEETWEIRSYESEPDDFSGGEDVFDIRTYSDEMALDGTFYNEW
ncbi:MAG: type II secretion system GspH family protein [Deltaproteobacteria bacterium]|nr:type II secretion system GspH family protein [Deltaproteobacteria bacterium]